MDEELRRCRLESNIRTRLKNTKGMLTRRRNEFEDLAYYYDDYTYDDLLRARHCFEEAWTQFGAALAEYAANGFDLDARYYVERHAYYEQSHRAMADLFDELASGAQDNFPPRSASELYPPGYDPPADAADFMPPSRSALDEADAPLAADPVAHRSGSRQGSPRTNGGASASSNRSNPSSQVSASRRDPPRRPRSYASDRSPSRDRTLSPRRSAASSARARTASSRNPLPATHTRTAPPSDLNSDPSQGDASSVGALTALRCNPPPATQAHVVPQPQIMDPDAQQLDNTSAARSRAGSRQRTNPLSRGSHHSYRSDRSSSSGVSAGSHRSRRSAGPRDSRHRSSHRRDDPPRPRERGPSEARSSTGRVRARTGQYRGSAPDQWSDDSFDASESSFSSGSYTLSDASSRSYDDPPGSFRSTGTHSPEWDLSLDASNVGLFDPVAVPPAVQAEPLPTEQTTLLPTEQPRAVLPPPPPAARHQAPQNLRAPASSGPPRAESTPRGPAPQNKVPPRPRRKQSRRRQRARAGLPATDPEQQERVIDQWVQGIPRCDPAPLLPPARSPRKHRYTRRTPPSMDRHRRRHIVRKPVQRSQLDRVRRDLELQRQQLDKERELVARTQAAVQLQMNALRTQAPAPPSGSSGQGTSRLSEQQVNQDIIMCMLRRVHKGLGEHDLKFSGNDPLLYPQFRHQFDANVTKLIADPGSCLEILLSCCTDRARHAIHHLAMEEDKEFAFKEALRVLEKNYGSAPTLVSAYLAKLHVATPVKDTREGIQDLLADLRTCTTVLRSCGQLAALDQITNLKPIFSRLPLEIRRKYQKRVKGRPPTHTDLVEVLEDHLTLKLDYVGQWVAELSLKGKAGSTGAARQDRKGAKGQNIKVNVALQGKPRVDPPPAGSASAASTAVTQVPERRECPVCFAREVHSLDKCPQYLKYNVRARDAMAFSLGYCFRCLNPGHMLRDCPSTAVCGKDGCSEKHHPVLHGLRRPTNPGRYRGRGPPRADHPAGARS